MKYILRLICASLLISGLELIAANVIMTANFDEETTDNFQNEYEGDIEVTDEYFSVGDYSLKVSAEPGTVDVERYIKYTENDTKLGFHYKANGVKALRVLASSVEDKENLFYNLTDLPQDKWSWAVVKLAELRNTLPRNSGIDKPLGDKSGKGKTFRNILFHACNLDKKSEETLVYLDNIVLYSGKDTKAPSLNGTPILTSDEQGRFLSWPAATDNIGVAYYKIFIGQSDNFDIKGLKPANTSVIPECDLGPEANWYRVVAVDYDGNVSEAGTAIKVVAKNN